MTDAADSYRTDRLSPDRRFDEVETTISHLFRVPHPALGQKTYGGALFAALASRGLLAGGEVTELGGGTGELARSVLDAPGAPALAWRFVDLSPRLLEAQRARVPSAQAVLADAEELPLRDASLPGLFLANEVIADLRVELATHPEAQERVARYRLPVGEHSLVNVGAIRLLEQLSRALAPGAAACLTEFGGDFEVGSVELYGALGAGAHTEHSIRFDHLVLAARALGLHAELLPLADLLGIDRTCRVASYPDVLRLRRLVPRLPVLAHPKATLEARHPVLLRLFDFELPEIGSPTFPNRTPRGGFCQLFFALLLRREA